MYWSFVTNHTLSLWISSSESSSEAPCRRSANLHSSLNFHVERNLCTTANKLKYGLRIQNCATTTTTHWHSCGGQSILAFGNIRPYRVTRCISPIQLLLRGSSTRPFLVQMAPTHALHCMMYARIPHNLHLQTCDSGIPISTATCQPYQVHLVRKPSNTLTDKERT